MKRTRVDLVWGWEGVDWFGQIGNYMDSMNIDV